MKRERREKTFEIETFSALIIAAGNSLFSSAPQIE
jgi:hypothetical protein